MSIQQREQLGEGIHKKEKKGLANQCKKDTRPMAKTDNSRGGRQMTHVHLISLLPKSLISRDGKQYIKRHATNAARDGVLMRMNLQEDAAHPQLYCEKVFFR
jgi:hypothetical protein